MNQAKKKRYKALFIWLIIRLIQLVFSAGTVFFSHKKSVNSIFQPAYNSSRTAPKHRLEISWSMEYYTPDGSRYLSCHMIHGCIIGTLAHCRLMKLDSHTQKTRRVHEATAAHDVYIASSFPSRPMRSCEHYSFGKGLDP
jgi:hypothetical protein